MIIDTNRPAAINSVGRMRARIITGLHSGAAARSSALGIGLVDSREVPRLISKAASAPWSKGTDRRPRPRLCLRRWRQGASIRPQPGPQARQRADARPRRPKGRPLGSPRRWLGLPCRGHYALAGRASRSKITERCEMGCRPSDRQPIPRRRGSGRLPRRQHLEGRLLAHPASHPLH